MFNRNTLVCAIALSFSQATIADTSSLIESATTPPEKCAQEQKNRDAFGYGLLAGQNGSPSNSPYTDITAFECFQLGYANGNMLKSYTDMLNNLAR